MKVPSTVARSLANYRGAEQHKAHTMLRAMGWLPDGTRATPEEIEKAREEWRMDLEAFEQSEIPF